MHAVRSRKLTKQRVRGVMGGMDKYYLSNVLAAIAASSQPNLAKGYEGKTWRCIAHQVRSYKNLKQNQKQQKSLPPPRL